MEDNDGNIHLKNLSLHQANNEEEGLIYEKLMLKTNATMSVTLL